ncbi:MAG: AAA family ATPase [Chlamydiota bacterium]
MGNVDLFYQLSQKFLHARNQVYRRYFIQKTLLSERMSILVGQRGIGKTTLLIQYLLDYAQGDLFSPKILYVPSDHLSLGGSTIYEIAEQFIQNGGEFIAFDEIHKAENWSSMLKSICDSFPKLKILASGSSALEIHKGSHDLSRRAIVYRILGMSFREYMEMTLDLKFQPIELKDLLSNHQKYCYDISLILEKNKKEKILPLFKGYLKHGFYPYWFELKEDTKFEITLEQNVHTTLEADLTSIYPHLSGTSIKKIRHLLTYIAQNVPYSPNWHNLSKILEIGDERTLKNYFTLLEDAELILSLYKSSKKLDTLGNPAKIYLQNTNLCYTIARGYENIGTLRETFIFNMLHKIHTVTLLTNGDFLIDKNILLEVGGAKKTKKQIWQESHAYIVSDDIEFGIGDKIPLWAFGFLY